MPIQEIIKVYDVLNYHQVSLTQLQYKMLWHIECTRCNFWKCKITHYLAAFNLIFAYLLLADMH